MAKLRKSDIEKLRRASSLIESVAERIPIGFTVDVGSSVVPGITTTLPHLAYAVDDAARRLEFVLDK